MNTDSATSTLADLIAGRRTIHEFLPDAVSRSVVHKAIEAARWAPNHRLTEPWHFYLLGPESIGGIISLNTEIAREKSGAQAAEEKQRFWSAIPGWMVLTCDRSDSPLRAQEDYAACCCAAQNFMLYLWMHGIGTKWTTGAVVRDPRFYELLWIDAQAEAVVGMFWYGYPRTCPVTDRKPLSQILVELP